jgi:hypothetical protein
MGAGRNSITKNKTEAGKLPNETRAVPENRMNIKNEQEAEFRPPMESRATRKVIKKSNASCRVIVVAKLPAHDRLRRYVLESRLEEKVFYLFQARPDVQDIIEQPTRVGYIGTDGKHKYHTFDFLVVLNDGRKIAIAVKPDELLGKSNLIGELQAIQSSLPRGFADEIEYVTDRDIDRVSAINAQRLCEFRRISDDHADETVAGLISQLKGRVPISEIVEQSKLKGRAFRAVFRALFDGSLEAIEHCIINFETEIQRKEAI